LSNIVISGGAGFIGYSLYKKFKDNHKIVAFDVDRSKSDVLYGNIMNQALLPTFKENDILIHCASIAGVDNVIEDPCKCWDVITFGTYNIVEKSKQSKIKKFIYLSTSEVMQNTAFGRTYDVGEKIDVYEARWIYSLSKLSMEAYVLRSCRDANIEAICLRPFNIFGPGQKTGGAIRKIILHALKNEIIPLINGGEQLRSWCYIDDFTRAVELCLTSTKANYKSISIGNPSNTLTIRQLANMIVRLSGSKSKIKSVKSNEPDIKLRIPDNTDAKVFLGFEPKIDLEEGLVKTIEYYRNERG
jgi:UDP-glucuronate decarboxylase